MKVTQEKLPDSRIGLEIEIPGEKSQTKYDTVVKNLARTVNIPGFRKGKIPRQILVQRLGSGYVKAAALEELLKDSIEDAIKQENIDSIGNIGLRSSFDELVQVFIPGVPLTFLAAVDVPPTVELGEISAIAVQAEEVLYDPQQVEDWLEERREQQATLVPVEDRPAEVGDVAIVDYQAYRQSKEAGTHGEAITEIVSTDFKIELDEGRFVAGIVEGIIGMSLDENKDILASFPEDYPLESVAGETVIFDITLKELKTRELPELNDEFADEISEFETLAELRESLEKRYQEEAQAQTDENIEKAIVSELIKICAVDLPDTLIQEETNRILTQTAMRMEQMGLDTRQIFTEDLIPKLRENARPEAVALLQRTLILLEIAEKQSLSPDETALTDRMAEIRTQFKNDDIDEDKLRIIVTEELTTGKALAWLREQVTVELVPLGTLTPVETEASPSEVTDETDDATITVEAEAVEADE